MKSSPLVTIILTSHMKPTLRDALVSVDRQTFLSYECVVMDSGMWHGQNDSRSATMGAIYGDYEEDSRVTWITTGEAPGLGDRVCPVAWATNEAIRRGLVRGKYVCTFYDDDEYEPAFLERMVGYLEATGEQAVWCTQDRVRLLASGERQHAGQIRADRVLTPGSILNRVDGGQVMFTRDALMQLGDPWLPEAPGGCLNSDGQFLERLCSLIGEIHPLDEMLYTHRFTPSSTYSPS